jgi:hypothetical protein
LAIGRAASTFAHTLAMELYGLPCLAKGIALKAGALHECRLHADILVAQYNPDAVTLACKIPDQRISAGKIELPNGVSRKKFIDLIKTGGRECDELPRCEEE